jgi:hypothetical protein
MRKAKTVAADELRSEYKRSNFGALVRGKYTGRLRASSNVVVIAPEVAELFPNAAAVNAALPSLAEIAKRAGSLRGRSRRVAANGEPSQLCDLLSSGLIISQNRASGPLAGDFARTYAGPEADLRISGGLLDARY